IRHPADRAHRIALAERDVTCLIIPNDLAEEPAEADPPREHGSVHSSPGYTRPKVVPPDEQLQAAAQILNQGGKVAMLVGQGALHATDEVIEVAEKLGAGVAKALLGKAAVPDDLPFVTGAIGLLGTKPSWTLMNECDTLLMIGSSFPYSEWLPKPGQARASRSTSTGKCSASAIRWSSGSSATLATMGPGVPYAIAAKFCHPKRPAVALVGDGAMQMNGMAELITAKKYFHQWDDPRLVVLVLNNQDLNQVTWEQRALQGDPENPMTQRIPEVNYAAYADLIGLKGRSEE